MNNTVLSIFYFIAFSHALMLIIALWHRSGNDQSGRILAVVVALLAYKLFEGGSLYSGLYQYIPHFLDLMPGMVLLLGPVFYGYVRKVLGYPDMEVKVWLLHLTPWIILMVVFNADSVLQPAEQKVAMWHAVLNSYSETRILPLEIVVRLLAIKVHLMTYLLLSWKELSKLKDSIDSIRSDNSAEILMQLRLLAITFIALEAIWVSLFLAQQYAGLGTLNQVSEIWLLFIGAVVIAMGFSGLQYPDLVFTREERALVDIKVVPVDSEKIKYIHSSLSENVTNEIAKLIESGMQNDHLYLNDKLTLSDLAKFFDLKSHTLSQVINQGMKTNFYRLINSYRVQHAIDLLDNENITWSIERVALESGFSNRVTFNKAFKDQMMCTASQYKEKTKQRQETA